jgi:rod shape-determining protein MreB
VNFSKSPTVANHIINAVLSHVRNNKDTLIEAPSPVRDATDVAEKIEQQFSSGEPPESFDPFCDKSVLHVGLDWGASKTCLKASFAGSEEIFVDESIPTVIGIAREGLIHGVLPGNATTLFGREALTHRRHLHLAYPTFDSAGAGDFARYLRSRLGVSPTTEIRAVVAAPVLADADTRENIRQNLIGSFETVILLPQPFLTALGYRDESRLLETDYVDPVRHSIFIDIGAAKTNLCIVQGYYPTANEQISIGFGGNNIDELLRGEILENYPEAEISPITLRWLKEQHAFVGPSTAPLMAEVVIGGRVRALDLTCEIKSACNQLLAQVFESLKTLITHAPGDVVMDLLENIILTGGGSRIKGIDAELERLLGSEGFPNPHVHVVGESYKGLAAFGALKAARQARDHHWQQVAR